MMRRVPFSPKWLISTLLVVTLSGPWHSSSGTEAVPTQGSTRLFYTDYGSVTDLGKVVPPWQVEQEPRTAGLEGEARADRIRVVPESESPPGARKHPGPTLRVELRPFTDPSGYDGDQHVGGDGYKANRAEVYARHAVPGSKPPEQWPDPVGSTRWYGISVFVPSDFESDRKLWLTFVQWKGYQTGSPPLALELRGDQFETGGAKKRHRLGKIEKGTWTNFVVGIHFSPDPQIGWVNIYRNGVEVLAKTYQATMKTKKIKGVEVIDPNYFKQGIYRTKGWSVTHVLYFGPTSIGTTKDSVTEYMQ